MDLTLEQAVGHKMLVAFDGYDLPDAVAELLKRTILGGVTLFRAMNARDPAQVRALTTALQKATRGGHFNFESISHSDPLPLLIGADQEGGQLIALAGSTPFPGNMALGATGSPELARRVGYATGREMAAMGININYAPVCDVNINPRNPVVGTRSFGEDPGAVARLAAAMVEGLQEAGIAATAKHFPGHGDTAIDSHFETPVLPHDGRRLHAVELPPFAAAIGSGAKLVMTAHVAIPSVTGGLEIPATLSPAIILGLLRGELAFQGVVVSDALDMAAIEQGPGLAVDAIAAAAAGVDLLMLTDYGLSLETAQTALLQAAKRGLLDPTEIMASARRVLNLKAWVREQDQPGLDVVGCSDHRALAYEVAARGVTLVRGKSGLLPLRLATEDRVLAIVPRPADLTPADTSSYETPALAEAVRRCHPNVDQIDVPLDPTPAEVGEIRELARGYNLAVVGTINATQHPGQAALVNALLDASVGLLAVALRLPYDIAAYPRVDTYACTYSLQPPSLEALADALWGRIPFQGQLPVTVESA